MIIAIDGPAASGKGTLARRLAARFGFVHLDTGALYRAVAAALLDAGEDPNDEDAAVAAARSLDPATLNDPRLRSGEVGKAASVSVGLPGSHPHRCLDIFQQMCVAAKEAAGSA